MGQAVQAGKIASRYFDLRTTVLLVVGHGILREDEDRPIACSSARQRQGGIGPGTTASSGRMSGS
jgi:hypothetical protein